MAVLVEGLSAVARRDAIDERYEGGWDGFVSDVPNGMLRVRSNLHQTYA